MSINASNHKWSQSTIALLFTLLAAATKSVTLTEAFLQLLPSLFRVICCMYMWSTKSVTAKEAPFKAPSFAFLGHLLYAHISYQICYRYRGLPTAPSFPFLGHLPYVHIRYQICYRYRGLPTAPSFPFFGSSTVCTYKLPNLLPPGTKPDPTSCQHRDRNLTGSNRIWPLLGMERPELNRKYPDITSPWHGETGT